MSLNDDADDDITMDSLFVTDTNNVNVHTDETSRVNPNQPVTEPKTILVDTDSKSPPYRPSMDELFGSPILKNELPNLNATFIDVTENNVHVAEDLFEVQQLITRANGVGREDVELIESISPGFTDKNPVGFYTQERSKTQLTQTVQSLGNEIDARISIISQGIMEYLDKAHEKYVPIVQKLEQHVMDKITSLQLEVQTLSIAANQGSINNILETLVGSGDDEQSYPSLPAEVGSCMLELDKLFCDTETLKKKLASIYYNQLFSIPGVYFPLGDKNSYVELIAAEPRIKDVDPALNYDPSGYAKNSLYYHTTLATGPGTIDQFKTMLGFIAYTVTQFSTYKELVKNTTTSTSMGKDVILSELHKHGAANVRDGLAVLNVIGFFEDFIKYLEKLKDVYTAIVKTQQTPSPV